MGHSDSDAIVDAEQAAAGGGDALAVGMAAAPGATAAGSTTVALSAEGTRKRWPRLGRRKRLAFFMGSATVIACAALALSWWRGTLPGAGGEASALRGARPSPPPMSPAVTYPAAAGARRLETVYYDGDGTVCTDGPPVLTIVGAAAGSPQCEGTCTFCCSDLDGWGGVILYFVVTLYTFLGLAIICDDFFCESLERISEALSLSDDVAGATFMAAGSSAPELFTAVVTILITGGSEGLGTIVGSAVFNIMIIVGVTALSAGQVLVIWWYPLTRDCIVYVISIIMMGAVVWDSKVEWFEGLILTLSYGAYIALMVYNERITTWVEQRSKKVTPGRRASIEERGAPPSAKSPTTTDITAAALRLAAAAEAAEREEQGSSTHLTSNASPDPATTAKPALAQDSPTKTPVTNALKTPEQGIVSTSPAGSLRSTASASNVLPKVGSEAAMDSTAASSGSAGAAGSSRALLAGTGGSGFLVAAAAGAPKDAEEAKPEQKEEKHKRGMNPLLKPMNRAAHDHDLAKERAKLRKSMHQSVVTAMKVNHMKNKFMKNILAKRAAAAAAAGGDSKAPAMGGAASAFSAGGGGGGLAAMLAGKAKEPEEPAKEEEEDEDEGGIGDKILDIFSLPYTFLFMFTVPDCREKKWEAWYMLTFTMSIVWIGILSFVMVDFAARAGCVLGVPGIVMGLIVIAAGTSVPDALSSILVAKNGQGDMAVANVLGSNVFNIFLGLGLPWFLKVCIDGFEPVQLNPNENIVVPIIILLLYVVIFVAAIGGNSWKLNATVGWAFIFAHLLFVAWNLLTMLDNPVINL